MKAVGETLEIALGIRLDQAKLVPNDLFKRPPHAFVFPDQQPRNLTRHFQNALRRADIDDQHAGHELRRNLEWRQRCDAVDRWRRAFPQT